MKHVLNASCGHMSFADSGNWKTFACEHLLVYAVLINISFSFSNIHLISYAKLLFDSRHIHHPMLGRNSIVKNCLLLQFLKYIYLCIKT